MKTSPWIKYLDRNANLMHSKHSSAFRWFLITFQMSSSKSYQVLRNCQIVYSLIMQATVHKC